MICGKIIIVLLKSNLNYMCNTVNISLCKFNLLRKGKLQNVVGGKSVFFHLKLHLYIGGVF